MSNVTYLDNLIIGVDAGSMCCSTFSDAEHIDRIITWHGQTVSESISLNDDILLFIALRDRDARAMHNWHDETTRTIG